MSKVCFVPGSLHYFATVLEEVSEKETPAGEDYWKYVEEYVPKGCGRNEKRHAVNPIKKMKCRK